MKTNKKYNRPETALETILNDEKVQAVTWKSLEGHVAKLRASVGLLLWECGVFPKKGYHYLTMTYGREVWVVEFNKEVKKIYTFPPKNHAKKAK